MNLFDNESEQVILGSLPQSRAFSDISLEIRPEFYFEEFPNISKLFELVDAGNQPEPLLINHQKKKAF